MQQAGGQACRHILNPEGALFITGQRADGAAVFEAKAAIGQEIGLKQFGHDSRIAFDAQIKRCLAVAGLGDAGCSVMAIAADPALRQPVRQIDEGRLLRQRLVFFAGNPAQHRIDQLGIGQSALVFPRGADGHIHRRMIGHIQMQ